MSAIKTALDDYQNWTVATAQYPEVLAIPYLGLGLGDEAGELLEKVTLMVSLGRSASWGLANVLSEGGDVCWYLAQLLLKRGHSLGDVFEQAMALTPEYDSTLSAAADEVAMACSAIQGRLKKELRDSKVDEERVLHHAARVLRALDSIARWFGSNLLFVVNDNRVKLTDRLERNVIKGEGDAR